jgi:hypothetical protein
MMIEGVAGRPPGLSFRRGFRLEMRTLGAGALYFALVFAAGCLLGPLRVLWLEPRFDKLGAVLMEAPLMIAAMIVAARWVVSRLKSPAALSERIAMGTIAVGLLLVAELTMALGYRSMSAAGYLASLMSAPGLVFLAMALVFAAMPALVGQASQRKAMRLCKVGRNRT